MTSETKPHLTRAHVTELLRGMIRIRRFEDKCAELYTREKIRGFLHLYDGEEAVAMGVSRCWGQRTALSQPTVSMAMHWRAASRWGQLWPRCMARPTAVQVGAAALCICLMQAPISMAAMQL